VPGLKLAVGECEELSCKQPQISIPLVVHYGGQATYLFIYKITVLKDGFHTICYHTQQCEGARKYETYFVKKL
jgi:hypothetical protein